MIEKNLITKEKYEELKAELENLIQNERPKVIEELQNAREQGDLSENADYDAAKEKQSTIENQIADLQSFIENSEIASKKNSSSNDTITVFTYVKYFDESEKKSYVYQIVGSSLEVDPENYKISSESPLAKALLNKKVGDTADVKCYDGHYKIKIEKISNSWID